ncbi:Dullard-like phosphatase domain-containing protein [Trypanosoma conorhini]|uniref:Dullard-like phosphatase domain-containing protein n=1 Tax=Trypanosoma conorhini TaxID=83891 RepID=A0A422Q6K3_9TRYP|nr:Dullard-like phosphatase domain-containing protein [Trypanosoma conorhini]RNF25581.1 Dullard-like phosphatase domain-containing protein [Trypanosoma conorhini]
MSPSAQVSPQSQPGASELDEYSQEIFDSALTAPMRGMADTHSFCLHHQFPYRQQQRQFHCQRRHREQVIPITSVHHGATEISRARIEFGAASYVHSKRHEVQSSETHRAFMGEHPHASSTAPNATVLPPPLVSRPSSSQPVSSNLTRGCSAFPRHSLQSSPPTSFFGQQSASDLHSAHRTRNPIDRSRQEARAQSLCGLEGAGGVRTVDLASGATHMRLQQQTDQEASSFLQRGGSSLAMEMRLPEPPDQQSSEIPFPSPLYLEATEWASPAATRPRCGTHMRPFYANYGHNYIPCMSEVSTPPGGAGTTLAATSTPREDTGATATSDSSLVKVIETGEAAGRGQQPGQGEGEGQYEQRRSGGDSTNAPNLPPFEPARCEPVPSSAEGTLVHPPPLSSKQPRPLSHQSDTDRKETMPRYLLPPQPECNAGRITCCLDLDNTLVYTFQRPPSWWDPENNPLHLEIEIASSVSGEGESDFDKRTYDDHPSVISLSFLSSQHLDSDTCRGVAQPSPQDRTRPSNPDRHYVCIRPYAFEFVQFCLEKFEVVFFTSGTEEYAQPIFDHLDPRRAAHRLYRHHCTECGEGMYMKDLSLLGRSLDSVILFDDRGPDVSFQPKNVLFCEPFILEEVDDAYNLATNDSELCGYREFLEMLTNLQREVMLQAIAAYQEEVWKVTMMLLAEGGQALEKATGAGADVEQRESP